LPGNDYVPARTSVQAPVGITGEKPYFSSESRADNRFQNAGPVEREGYEQLAPPVTAKRTKAC